MNFSSKKLTFFVATSLLFATSNSQCVVGTDCATCAGNVCTACQLPAVEKIDPTNTFCATCPGAFCTSCTDDL